MLARNARLLRLPYRQVFRFNSTKPTLESAQQTASKVWSATQTQGKKAFTTASKLAGGAGERLGGMLGSYRQPLMYNLEVARELLKQIYIAENLKPPRSMSTLVEAYTNIFNHARKADYWRGVLRSGDWAKLGIYALEAYGIFKIGEIIGRRSLIGYKVQ